MGTPLFLLPIMPSSGTSAQVPPVVRPPTERTTPPHPHALCPNGHLPLLSLPPLPLWRLVRRLLRTLHSRKAAR